jgi:hypothetical protein
VEKGEKLAQLQLLLFIGAMENHQLCSQFMLKPLGKT